MEANSSSLRVVKGTPLQTVMVHGIPVLVKREDLCCPHPGPSFSKIRGVYAHLRKRPESVIGVLDTLHSKAGWAVSYVCKALGKRVFNYYPVYKSKPDEFRLPQRIAREYGASLVPLPAGRSAVLYHSAKRDVMGRSADAYMMPNALKLYESVTENRDELLRTAKNLPKTGTMIISMSSGTVAAGVMAGLRDAGLLGSSLFHHGDWRVVLHMGYSRSDDACRRYISAMAGDLDWRFIHFVDQGYAYADKVDVEVPFPCNEYYDAKAWKWLLNEQITRQLDAKGPIVFWNIGA